MIDLASKDYLVIVQCEIVKQRCPGYLCEKAWHERTGGFAAYPKDKSYGGCCGRGLHRKLTLLKRTIKKKENIEKDKIIVQLSSCITKDNYHAPPCPHRDYIRALVSKIGMDYLEDTVISRTAQRRREEGIYSE